MADDFFVIEAPPPEIGDTRKGKILAAAVAATATTKHAVCIPLKETSPGGRYEEVKRLAGSLRHQMRTRNLKLHIRQTDDGRVLAWAVQLKD